MSDDNDDWDKVPDCIIDDSITDNRLPSSSEKTAHNNTLNSEVASLATVSLMSTTQHKDERGDEDDDTDDDDRLATPQSQPLQIVSVGDEDDEYAFQFHDKSMDSVLRKIPPGMKVCVVSVVGAFRTGKSFLLSWFLRYLHLASIGGGDGESEGEEGKKWYETLDSLGNDGFHWRGGAERNTTGIWMWSTPHILPRTNNDGTKENIAVLLVDTQGMFDHETTMGLTAAIFGLSTLLSSYQIYNVDKRIQEDHLQQLAMFSEYGRMALHTEATDAPKPDKDVPDSIPEEDDEDTPTDTKATKPRPILTKSKSTRSSSKTITTPIPPPFQKMEFLVRDWQNFEDDEDLPACEAEMITYLETVLAERAGEDLRATREQINSCFEDISCYLLTHPGFGVTKKKYTGDVNQVEPTFLALLDRYCKRVFENPVAKVIHGRELTAGELGAYIKNYAEMFASGAHFPEAATMLDATANANNTNAADISTKAYREKMDSKAGARCTHYIQPDELRQSHRNLAAECEDMFDDMANFGSAAGIEKARGKMEASIFEDFQLYNKLNDSRNPLAGFETFIIPLTIGFISMTLRWIADSTCSSWSQTCKAGSDAFSHVYQVVFFFLLIVSFTKYKQLSVVARKFKKAIDVVIGDGGTNDEAK